MGERENAHDCTPTVVHRDERKMAAKGWTARIDRPHVERRPVVGDRPADRMRRIPDGGDQTLERHTLDAFGGCKLQVWRTGSDDEDRRRFDAVRRDRRADDILETTAV